jgi:hypothetical protein
MEDGFTKRFALFQRRIVLLATELMLCRALTVAALLAIILLVLSDFTGWYVAPLYIVTLCILGLCAGAIAMRVRYPAPLAIARTIEQRHPLDERISTAIALHDEIGEQPFRELVIADAAAHLATITPIGLFPHRFTPLHKLALGSWGMVLVLLLLPQFSFLQTPGLRADRLGVHIAGEQLQGLAKTLEAHTDLLKNPEVAKTLHEMKKLAQDLDKNRLPRKEALKRLNSLNDKLKKLEQAAKPSPAEREQMQQAADALQKSLQARTPAEQAAAERARQKLAHGGKTEQLSAQEQNALAREAHTRQAAQSLEAGDMQRANDELRKLGSDLQDQPAAGTEECAQLAQAMQHLAAASKTDAQALSAAAQKAATALQQGSAQSQKDAANTMSRMSDPSNAQTAQELAAAQHGLDDAKEQMSSAQSQMAATQGQSGNSGSQQSGAQQGMQSGGQHGQQGGNQPGSQAGNQPGQGGGKESQANGQSGNSGQQPGGAGGRGGITGGGGGLDRDAAHRLAAGYHRQNIHVAVGPGSALVIPGDSLGGGQTSNSNVSYHEVYANYSKRASHALDGDQVPPEDRQRVKAYFDALNRF